VSDQPLRATAVVQLLRQAGFELFTGVPCSYLTPLIDAVIDEDPRDYGYRCTVWTAPLLGRYLKEVHGIETSCKSVSRAIARLGIRWKRPRHRLGLRPDTWRQAKGGSKTA